MAMLLNVKAFVPLLGVTTKAGVVSTGSIYFLLALKMFLFVPLRHLQMVTSTIVRIVSFLMMQLTMIGTVGTTSSMARMITNTSHVVRSLSTLHIGKRVVVL